MKAPWSAAPFLLAIFFTAGGLAARAGYPESLQVPALVSADSGRRISLPVLLYSGRNDNKDVYILHPGEQGPRNLTNHPAQDLCPAASPDGTRILFLSDRGGNLDVFSMAPDGSDVRSLTASPETEEHPEFTPDGARILFVRDFETRTEIWIMNADGSEARRLTNNEARDERPFMSPDGLKIIFMSNRDGNYEIYTMAPDGSGQARLTNTPEWEIFPVWSPDGTKIAYARKARADGRMQGMVRVMNADGTGDRAVTAIETRDENPMWAPDGRHIILQSVRDGNFEVYQVDLDGGRPVRLTDHPAWDGWACYLPVKDMQNIPTEPYLGQKPPGMTPEVFAPGVVCRDGIQMKLTMSADGAEILYTERDPATNAASFILRRRAGDSWGEPLVLPYSREYLDIEPSLSPDGKKILFVSNRPTGGQGDPEKMPDIWMAVRSGDHWGHPGRLAPPVRTDDPADIEAHPAFLPDGGIYFMRQSGKSRRLFQAARRGDRFDVPVPLPLKEDLLAGQFSGPCLSPDGRTLLMHSRREGGFGNWDLYVAFKDGSGGWSELKNLGPAVNSDKSESSPTFSPDGRTVFFTRETDIYWVSAEIIGQLRPTVPIRTATIRPDWPWRPARTASSR